MEKTNKKRKKTGGRKKGTPNKISKKIAKAIFEEYFYEEIRLGDGEETTTRFNELLQELEYIALNTKKDDTKLKAIDIILKTLGAYNNKALDVNIDNDDKKINIMIIDN